MRPKPRLFLASSSEGYKEMQALQANLFRIAEVTIWGQGFFQPSHFTLESLEEGLKGFDFAAFLFRPDDVSQIRNETKHVVRDNVVFELGLAIGKLGRKRSFIVQPRDTELHLPTDLLGLTPTYYDAKASDPVAAMGTAAYQIQQEIEKLGLVEVGGPLGSLGIMGARDPLGGEAIRERLAKAKRVSVLKTWFPEDPSILDGLEQALSEGAATELILCKPDSEILRIRSEGAGQNLASAAHWIVEGLKAVRQAVSKNRALSFAIGFYDVWPGCPVIWADDEIYMGFYFYGRSSPNWPWVEVKPDSYLARILQKQRDSIRDRAEKLSTLEELETWLNGWERRQGSEKPE